MTRWIMKEKKKHIHKKSKETKACLWKENKNMIKLWKKEIK